MTMVLVKLVAWQRRALLTMNGSQWQDSLTANSGGSAFHAKLAQRSE